MAGTTRKSLAGSAAAAAKRVIGRRSKTSAPQATEVAETAGAAKSAPAKKAPAKKAPAKKAPAKKAPAKKAPAKKVSAKAAPAKKASATKAAAAKAPAKKTSAKKAPVTPAAPATKTPATKTPATKVPAKKAPAKKSPAKKSPAKKAPTTEAAPAKKTAAKKAPVKKTPATQATTTSPAKKASVTNAGSTKKPASRKPTPAKLVVLEGEDAWTRGELDEVVQELNEHRDRLTASIDQAEEELTTLMRDAGDGAGHDQADVGATSFERDHELTVLAREKETLGQLDRALAHIDDGTYGVCESCGNPIGKNRLMAVPHATLCMSCKQREERR